MRDLEFQDFVKYTGPVECLNGVMGVVAETRNTHGNVLVYFPVIDRHEPCNPENLVHCNIYGEPISDTVMVRFKKLLQKWGIR